MMEEMEMRKEKRRGCKGRKGRKGERDREGERKGRDNKGEYESGLRGEEEEKRGENEMQSSLVQQGLRVQREGGRVAGLNDFEEERESALAGWQALIGSGHKLILFSLIQYILMYYCLFSSSPTANCSSYK